MILLKACAFITLVFAILIGFELLVDLIRFGGAKLSSGTVVSFGTTLGMFFVFAAMLVTGFDGLIG